MRRLTVTLLTLALAALAAPAAQAKGIAKLTTCGASGCQDATPDENSHDIGVLEGGPEIGAPAERAPYYSLRVLIGVPDQPEGPAIRILYAPALHAMRVASPDGAVHWMQPTDTTEDALKRAVTGLVPFDAAGLDLSSTSAAPTARVVEVVPAPSSGDGNGDGGGGDWLGWAAGAAGALLLLGGGWAALRRRRGRPGLHPAG